MDQMSTYTSNTEPIGWSLLKYVYFKVLVSQIYTLQVVQEVDKTQWEECAEQDFQMTAIWTIVWESTS